MIRDDMTHAIRVTRRPRSYLAQRMHHLAYMFGANGIRTRRMISSSCMLMLLDGLWDDNMVAGVRDQVWYLL